MSDRNIILTGFMGTGKSTLGRLLAERLQYRFIDTDVEIESRNGCSVATIFKEQGEAAFRTMESELVAELAQRRRLVIATGGGLVMNPANVERLSASGTIICLTAETGEILERVARQADVRPLLQESDPRARVNELLRQREPVYAQFAQLSTTGRSPDSLVSTLLEMLLPN